MAGSSTNIESRLNRQGWIVLSVKDSGIGMAPGDIERALQPFSQLETNIIHEQEGVGLGRSIASRLAAMHDGKLHLESKRGAGALAHVLLPAGPVVDQGDGARTPQFPIKHTGVEFLYQVTGISSLAGYLAKFSSLIIFESLNQFLPRIHHEWAMAGDRLADGDTAKKQEPGGVPGTIADGKFDAVARAEDDQLTLINRLPLGPHGQVAFE